MGSEHTKNRDQVASILEISQVYKKYKTKDTFAIKNLNFSLSEGEIVGILGPNGAGKTTLIKMILGVVKPTSGSIAMFGKSSLKYSNKDKSKMGVYIGGKSNLIFHLPVKDSLRLFQSIYQVPKQKFEENVQYFGDILQCRDFLDQRVGTLSLGQKLRAELLCILIYEPQILILDEPTLGLDIEGKRQIRDMIQQLAEQKKISVLITTHDVNDMERLCTGIIMICDGEKVMEYSREDYTILIRSHVIFTVDMEFQSEHARLLEKNSGEYRYIVHKDNLKIVRETLMTFDQMLIKESEPKLEDLLYEYYR